jgi:FKBP-type peptidyl-prolyl cis-trans isomerase FkpA
MNINKVLNMKLINILLAGACVLTLNACNAQTSTQESSKTNATKDAATMTNITELQKIDTQVGTGREAEPGFNVSVHYTGWLYDAAAEGKKGKKI